MKELLRRCPHHQIPRWQVLQGFYGLTEAHRQTIDSSCGGSLVLNSEDEAWVLFDTLSENSLHNTRPSVLRHQSGKRGVLELGSSPQVNAAQGFSRPAYDPYSSTYNSGWRNHPNFGWRNTGYQSQTQSAVPPQRQIAYSQPSGFQASSSSSTLEDRLLKVCEDIRLSNEKAHSRFD
ncbi:unnamed protein product [Victoria cruziana]